MKKCIYGLFLTALLLPFPAWSQPDTIDVPSDFGVGEGGLNSAITSASTPLSNHVFRLAQYGLYILSATVTVPAGDHLTILGPVPGSSQAEAPAQIIWTSNTAPNKNFNFDCYGDITLKNLWLLYADASGTQYGSSLQMEDNPAANSSGKGERGDFDGVIFDYSECPANAGGAVCITAAHFKGTFKNCYFRNCIDTHLRYYGRAVSFPYNTTAWHTDSLSFENCTFANMGYVYMQESNEYADYLTFNHCTFLNSMMFTLESGWWHWLAVTNSVYVDAYMLGDEIYQRGTSATYPNGGAINIDSISTFGFAVPWAEADRHVLFASNSYCTESWLSSYMANNPYTLSVGPDSIPTPQPIMSQKTLDYFNAHGTWPFFTLGTNFDGQNPNFILEPTDQTAIERFLYFKWTTNSDTNWAYHPELDYGQSWPMGEALSYTNGTLKTAAMGGFPLGDLYNWWSTKYNQWAAQADMEHRRISLWLTNGGSDPGPQAVHDQPSVAATFELLQNYPNPFNPATEIVYGVPSTGPVSLVVYNLLGQKVATLFEGTQHPGTYTVTFDGSKLASGVYFYTLQFEDRTLTKKLVLMK